MQAPTIAKDDCLEIVLNSGLLTRNDPLCKPSSKMLGGGIFCDVKAIDKLLADNVVDEGTEGNVDDELVEKGLHIDAGKGVLGLPTGGDIDKLTIDMKGIITATTTLSEICSTCLNKTLVGTDLESILSVNNLLAGTTPTEFETLRRLHCNLKCLEAGYVENVEDEAFHKRLDMARARAVALVKTSEEEKRKKMNMEDQPL